MNEWLKSHEYLAGWAGVAIALASPVLRTVEKMWEAMLPYLFLTAALLVIRFPDSREAMKDTTKLMVQVIVVLIIASSLQKTLTPSSEGNIS